MSEQKYYVGIDMQSTNKVINLPTPTADGDAASKSYVDTQVAGVTGQLQYQGVLDASAYTNELDNQSAGDYWVISVAGTVEGVEVAVGDILLLNSDTTEATSNDFDKIDNTDLSETDVKALFSAGAGLTYADGVFSVTAGGIDTTQLANDSVDKDKIAADVAGNGLGQNVDGSLEVNVDDSSIEISGDAIQIKAEGIDQTHLEATLEGKIVTSKQQLFGDGALNTFTFTHSFNTPYISVTTYIVSTGEEVKCFIDKTSDNEVSIGAFPAPAFEDLLVIVDKKVIA